MSTIATTIDRAFRTYLEPPDYQPAASVITNALTASAGDVSIGFGTFEVPEDINLLRIGSIIEVGSELMRVTGWDELTSTATVKRAIDGTPIEEHADGSRVKLSPSFPRYSVFESVRDNITALYPDLWTTTVEVISSIGPGIFPVSDPLIVETIEVNPEGSNGGWNRDFDGSISEYRLEAGGRAFVTTTWQSGTLVGRFRRRFGVATSEDDTYEELGLMSSWEPIVVIGAAADLLAGREIPNSHVEWVQATLQAEVLPPGTGMSIAVRMQQYRQLLVDRFAKEMKAEESSKPKVHFANPFQQVG